MAALTRRDLSGATALIGPTSLPLSGAWVAKRDVPTADAKQPGFKIESRAMKRVLRP